MNTIKWLKLGGIILAALSLVGVWMALGQANERVLAAPGAPQATTLKLAVPNLSLELGGGPRTMDLWAYTTYDGDNSALVFTVTSQTSEWFANLNLVEDDHYLTISEKEAETSRYQETIDVEVSDGTLMTTTEFTVWVKGRPELDFYPTGYSDVPLPDPLFVQAGGGLDAPIDLWGYAEDGKFEDAELSFALLNTLPTSLGVTLDEHFIHISPTAGFFGTFLVDVAVADSGSLTGTGTFTVASTVATSLTFDLPTYLVMEVNDPAGTTDLSPYTTYDGKRELEYTIVGDVPYNATFDASIFTSTMTITPTANGYGDRSGRTGLEIQASDGNLTATDIITVVTHYNPVVDFYPDTGPALPNPLVVRSGVGVDPINLWDYASDYEFYDESLTFSIPASETLLVDLGLSFSGTHHLNILPVVGTRGLFQVPVRAEDPFKLASTGVLTVQVVDSVYLPAVSGDFYSTPWLNPIQRLDDFFADDGHYRFDWYYPPGGYYQSEFSYNDPSFANGQIANVWGEHESGFYTWPGTHYWRLRAVDIDGNPLTGWSNVQSAYVGNYVYLYTINESYAFDMKVELVYNNVNHVLNLDTRSEGYWRSFPAGRYTLRITNQLCYPDTRTQTVNMTNAVQNGAWYVIDTCEPVSGPLTSP